MLYEEFVKDVLACESMVNKLKEEYSMANVESWGILRSLYALKYRDAGYSTQGVLLVSHGLWNVGSGFIDVTTGKLVNSLKEPLPMSWWKYVTTEDLNVDQHIIRLESITTQDYYA